MPTAQRSDCRLDRGCASRRIRAMVASAAAFHCSGERRLMTSTSSSASVRTDVFHSWSERLQL